jgi:hypothetical protein
MCQFKRLLPRTGQFKTRYYCPRGFLFEKYYICINTTYLYVCMCAQTCNVYVYINCDFSRAFALARIRTHTHTHTHTQSPEVSIADLQDDDSSLHSPLHSPVLTHKKHALPYKNKTHIHSVYTRDDDSSVHSPVDTQKHAHSYILHFGLGE